MDICVFGFSGKIKHSYSMEGQSSNTVEVSEGDNKHVINDDPADILPGFPEDCWEEISHYRILRK